MSSVFGGSVTGSRGRGVTRVELPRRIMAAGSMVVALAVATTIATGPEGLLWNAEETGLSDAILYQVDGTGSDALWTVGVKITRNGTLLEFDPLALRRVHGGWVSTRQPVTSGRLDDVAVRGPADVWAVGSVPDSAEARPLVQRWNGTRWKVVAGPRLAPGHTGSFTAVSATPDGDLWVAGDAQTATGESRRLIYRYAKGVWSRVGVNGLEHLTYVSNLVPVSSRDVWAVGIGGIAHFDGTRWKRAELPGDVGPRVLNIHDLVVRGPNDVWAVGHRPDDTLWRRPLVVHFDGVTWREIPSPADTAQMHSIEFVGDRAMVFGEELDTYQQYVLDQQGARFIRVANPHGAGTLLDSIGLRERIWTVGTQAGDDEAVPSPYVASADL
jgi:hypothetical protein